jgi:hypothetical protein
MRASLVHDAAFYETRASRYAMLVRLEPDPAIRLQLEQVVRLCRDKAAALMIDGEVPGRFLAVPDFSVTGA